MSEETLAPETKNSPIYFYGHTPPKDGRIGPHVFSQWYRAAFELNGTLFLTAEHYMMFSKAVTFGDHAIANDVLRFQDPEPVKRLGRLVQGYEEETWKRVRYQIVCRGTYEKFRQNYDLAAYLVSTGDVEIYEASPYDKIWGIGLTADNARDSKPEEWPGLNLLGKALMAAREMLRAR